MKKKYYICVGFERAMLNARKLSRATRQPGEWRKSEKVMKTEKQQQRKEVAGGFIIMERTIKTKNGRKVVTPWHVVYDSRCGY